MPIGNIFYKGFCTVLLLSFLLTPLYAGSEEFDSQMFKPSPFGESFITVRSGKVKTVSSWNIGFNLHYQHDPLVMKNVKTGKVVHIIVGDQITAELNGAYGVTEWFDIGISMPLIPYQSGDGWLRGDSLSSFGLGDLRIIPRFRLFEMDAGLLSVAFISELTLPTGKITDPLLGSSSFTLSPGIAVSSDFKYAEFAADVSYKIVDERKIGSMDIKNSIQFGVGSVYHAIPDKLDITGELFGEVAENSYLEAVGGIRYSLTEEFFLKAGFGKEIRGGYATPSYRAFCSLDYFPKTGKKREKPEEKKPVKKKKVPKKRKIKPSDRDRDGIPDKNDKCPAKAEDIDGFKDKDGCPDFDNDLDKIPDVTDKCPLKPEDMDKFQDTDGCPDLDNDQDKIPDVKDECPLKAEIYNSFQDTDGCPDTVVKKKPSKMKTGTRLNARVYFHKNSTEIKDNSLLPLKKIALIFKANYTIKMRIEGHTDSKESEHLAIKRAAAAKKYLLSLGVDGKQIIIKGIGALEPMASSETEIDSRKNRRVEFFILEDE